MEKTILLIGFCLLVLTGQVLADAEKEHSMPGPVSVSPELEKIKALAGHWEGTTTTDGKTEPAAVEYSVTSGGSAVVEKLFPGTPHEMVSVYHDEAGKLMMTHYCMLGNQPKLQLVGSQASAFNFDLAPGNSFDPAKDQHMHSLQLAFEGEKGLTQSWTCYLKGQSDHTTLINLKRV